MHYYDVLCALYTGLPVSSENDDGTSIKFHNDGQITFSYIDGFDGEFVKGRVYIYKSTPIFYDFTLKYVLENAKYYSDWRIHYEFPDKVTTKRAYKRYKSIYNKRFKPRM